MYDKSTVQRTRRVGRRGGIHRCPTRAAPIPERHDPFTTISGAAVERLYTPADLADLDYDRDLNLPGRYPYTRGVHPTGYRGKLWTMRMFAGFGTAEETNARFKYLLDAGADRPVRRVRHAHALWLRHGRAGGHRRVRQVRRGDLVAGRYGGAARRPSARPRHHLHDHQQPGGDHLGDVHRRGRETRHPRAALGGTIQNDILKEFIAQKEFLFPPAPSMRLVVDTIEFGTREMPKWNTISISGYHIREAGSTAAQELAFTLADGFAYVEAALARGLAVDDFAPRLSFFFNVHNEFFEEIAKFRAARRIWARALREKYGARIPARGCCARTRRPPASA